MRLPASALSRKRVFGYAVELEVVELLEREPHAKHPARRTAYDQDSANGSPLDLAGPGEREDQSRRRADPVSSLRPEDELGERALKLTQGTRDPRLEALVALEMPTKQGVLGVGTRRFHSM